jgi:hypothetical protein
MPGQPVRNEHFGRWLRSKIEEIGDVNAFADAVGIKRTRLWALLGSHSASLNDHDIRAFAKELGVTEREICDAKARGWESREEYWSGLCSHYNRKPIFPFPRPQRHHFIHGDLR